MPEEPDVILRKSLDAVDRHRRRTLVALVVTGALAIAAFLHFGRAFLSGNVAGMMHVAVIAFVLWTCTLTLVLLQQMAVMTKRILRAIELASKRSD